MVLDTLGDRLRASRKKAGLSQDALAELLAVHPKTVSRWENNAQPPEADALRAAAEALRVSEAWLRYGDDVAISRPFTEHPERRRRTGRIPPRAYGRLYGYLERLEKAGADAEQLEEAERIILDRRYAKLHKSGSREPSEDELLIDIDAGWAAVWEVLTAGGMRIPGPKPRFGKAEEGA